jgi:TrmH family RNA methyltransferase
MRDVTSRANPLIKHLVRLGREVSYRREHGLMLCEGEKMLAEALNAGIVPRHAVFSSEQQMPLPSRTELIRVPKDVMGAVSKLKTSPSVLFTVPIPDMELCKIASGMHIILDRLQDPGNVGSIIRTARALGISSVILTPACADVTNPKTLRAAMGAVFSQRLMYGEPDEILGALDGYKCFATGFDSDALPLGTVDLSNCAVVIGNEGSGVSDTWGNSEMLTIPIEFESLGAASAAAIIMWAGRSAAQARTSPQPLM